MDDRWPPENFAKVNSVLASLVEFSPSPPPWAEAWKALKADPSLKARLALFRQVRDAGSLPEPAVFHLISYTIDEIVACEAGEVLEPLERRMSEIEEAYRLEEGGIWPPGSAPLEYDQLREQCYDAWDDFYATRLAELGETEMARLFREDRQRFEDLAALGRQYFNGPEEPEDLSLVWLLGLVRAIADTMIAGRTTPPLGYRYSDQETPWVVDVFPRMLEIVGGAQDGARLVAEFAIDVEQLRSLFEEIDELAWVSQSEAHSDGPHLTLQGNNRGHKVVVRILAFAPEDDEPGMRVDAQNFQD